MRAITRRQTEDARVNTKPGFIVVIDCKDVGAGGFREAVIKVLLINYFVREHLGQVEAPQ